MSRLSIPEKESIVHSYQTSGQNLKTYSNSIGVSSSTLHGWVKKYGTTSKKRSLQPPVNHGSFIAVDLPTSSNQDNELCQSVTIKLPNGIEICGDFTASSIKTILSAYV